MEWISESTESSFFWLYGPAGAGKTAILQAIAEFLCSPPRSGSATDLCVLSDLAPKGEFQNKVEESCEKKRKARKLWKSKITFY